MDLLANPYYVAAAGTLAAGALYYLFGGGFGVTPRPSFCSFVGQEPSNSSKVIRNYRIGDGKLTSSFGTHETVYSAMQSSIASNGNRRCMGTRPLVKVHTEQKTVRGRTVNWTFPEMGPLQWITYNEVSQKIDAIGSGLVQLGVKARENVAIYLETCCEWSLTAHGAFSQNMVVMTCYANLGEEALLHSLNEAECSVIVTSGDLLLSLSDHRSNLPHLKTVVYCEESKVSQETLDSLHKGGVKTMTFVELEQLGKSNPVAHQPPTKDDVAVLMYTSGSTGLPKGVLCSHQNCMSSVGGVMSSIVLNPGDVHLSYLPLAHILAFVVETGCFSCGVSVAYGNPRTLSEAMVRNCVGDIAEAKPSFFVGVPTVFDKLKAGISSKVEKSGGLTKAIFDRAYASKKYAMSQGKDTPIWNAIVFKKFKAGLGGNVRFVVSGGAPLSKECGEFLRVCFGVPVLQGYALTETVAGGTLGEMDDLDSHLNVGPPICSTEFKLVDVPEMKYVHTNKPPTGEIWIRGPNVSKGYYKNPEKTKEEFTDDGWFKSGDIGRLNPNGTMSIIDRKKNLIKPPHGEYVAVERLESSYKNCPLVANILVYACSDHNEVVALIFPNKPALEKVAQDKGLDLSWEDLCHHAEGRKAVKDALLGTWKDTKLKSFERIHNVWLFPEEWTADNDWLTAALKLKRFDIQKAQADIIQKLYDEMN